jgi:hypothetical protein
VDSFLEVIRQEWFKRDRLEIDEAKTRLFKTLDYKTGALGFWDEIESGLLALPGFELTN